MPRYFVLGYQNFRKGYDGQRGDDDLPLFTEVLIILPFLKIPSERLDTFCLSKTLYLQNQIREDTLMRVCISPSQQFQPPKLQKL